MKISNQPRLEDAQRSRLVELINRAVTNLGLDQSSQIWCVPKDTLEQIRQYRRIVTVEEARFFCRNTGISPLYIFDGTFPVYRGS